MTNNNSTNSETPHTDIAEVIPTVDAINIAFDLLFRCDNNSKKDLWKSKTFFDFRSSDSDGRDKT